MYNTVMVDYTCTQWHFDVTGGLKSSLKNPSQPQSLGCIGCVFHHFLCHGKSGFFQSELKSYYILAIMAYFGA